MSNFNETIKATKSGRISVASYYDEIFWESEDEPMTAEDEAKATEAAQISTENATDTTDDDETTKHTVNVENASEWTIDETNMTDVQWLCKWLSVRRPEYKAVCKWMFEREEERKTKDSLETKETREQAMIVGGRDGGGLREHPKDARGTK